MQQDAFSVLHSAKRPGTEWPMVCLMVSLQQKKKRGYSWNQSIISLLLSFFFWLFQDITFPAPSLRRVRGGRVVISYKKSTKMGHSFTLSLRKTARNQVRLAVMLRLLVFASPVWHRFSNWHRRRSFTQRQVKLLCPSGKLCWLWWVEGRAQLEDIREKKCLRKIWSILFENSSHGRWKPHPPS